MVLAEIRDMIRAESVTRGLREYTSLIDNLINQELQKCTGKGRYAELLEETTFTQNTEDNFEVPVPANFQLFDSFTYTPYLFSSVGWPAPFTLSKGLNRGFEMHKNGIPKFYLRYGNVFRIYPYTEFYVNDTLTLAYYKRPELILDDDPFPEESLINPVQLFVMARMLRMRDSKQANAVRVEAQQALVDARAEANGS